MSYKENTANWQWKFYAAPDIPDVLEGFTGFIDDKLDLPDGRTVYGQPFAFSREGMMDVYDVIPERPAILTRTILTADFTAEESGTLLLGLAADWRWTFRCNGVMLLDARVTANSEDPIRPDNHFQSINYNAGRNQIIMEIFGGRTMTTACKIMPPIEPLYMRYKPFISFPDGEDNAVTVIFTSNRRSPAAVEYRLQGTAAWKRVYDNLGGQARHDKPVHCIRLRNLQPDSVYEYKVILFDDCCALKEVSEPVDTFKTAPRTGDFRFTVTADLQNSEVRSAYLESLIGKNNTFKPDFFAFCGDLRWTTDYDWAVMDTFVVPYREITDNHLPLVMVRGNHEIYGKESNRYFEYFSAPEPGREGYYMFRWGEVCFIVLDFGDDFQWVAPPSTRQYHDIEPYLEAESAWLKNAVHLPICRDAKFRIVLAHGIPVGDSKDYMPGHVHQIIDPIFGGEDPQVKIHLWLGGHIHRPTRSVPMKNACYCMLDVNTLDNGKGLPHHDVKYRFPVVVTGGPNGKLADNMQFTSIDVEVTADALTVHSRDRYQQEFDCITIAPDGTVTEISSSEEFKYYEF